MKSVQVSYLGVDDAANYSHLQVLKSAAGYYVGTTYQDPSGFIDSGSRDTSYFCTAEDAEQALCTIDKVHHDMIIEDEGLSASAFARRFNVHANAALNSVLPQYDGKLSYRLTP